MSFSILAIFPHENEGCGCICMEPFIAETSISFPLGEKKICMHDGSLKGPRRELVSDGVFPAALTDVLVWSLQVTAALTLTAKYLNTPGEN